MKMGIGKGRQTIKLKWLYECNESKRQRTYVMVKELQGQSGHTKVSASSHVRGSKNPKVEVAIRK